MFIFLLETALKQTKDELAVVLFVCPQSLPNIFIDWLNTETGEFTVAENFRLSPYIVLLKLFIAL